MPTTAVIDASFVLALFLPHPSQAAAQKTYDDLTTVSTLLIAPTLWIYEVTSGIQKLAHFQQISSEQAAVSFSLVENFQISLIQPDFRVARRALAWSQRLRRASAYDSFYLAMAEERGCDLWTADSRLSNAANVSWVRLLV